MFIFIHSLDFNVMDESGDLQHWKYTIEYTQKLSHWPRMENVGVANYEMISDLVHLNYLINATQRACFVSGMYCCKNIQKITELILTILYYCFSGVPQLLQLFIQLCKS